MNGQTLKRRLSLAVKDFWGSRARQKNMQGAKTGIKDYGNRGAVTGAAHANAFLKLLSDIAEDAGFEKTTIYLKKTKTILPGFFRPCRSWDLLVVSGKQLLAVVEFKSHVGSFGNNANNRMEEAIGSACDFWTAYREGVFAPSIRPWTGYFMLTEEHEESLRIVKCHEPHFRVSPAFCSTSYIDRYKIMMQRLIRERMYDAACLLISKEVEGMKTGRYREPCAELTFAHFAASMRAHLQSHKQYSDGTVE